MTYVRYMAFGEIFTPGMAEARKQLEAERILPAPPPVAGPPLFDLPDLGVEFDVTWTLNPDADVRQGRRNDSGAAEATPPSTT